MDSKKKFRIVIIVPVIATVIIAGLAIYFVLQVGASGAGHKGVTYSPELGQVADPAHITVASNEEGEATEGAAAPELEEAACDFNQWVGKAIDEDAVKATGRPYRILAPDSMATQDFSPQRINVMVDDKKVVTAVRCG